METASLICPICQQDCINLFLLNQHLDLEHSEVASETKKTLQSWFKKKFDTARSLPPVALLKRELSGTISHNLGFAESQSEKPSFTALKFSQQFNDDCVTRSHWQQQTSPRMKCSYRQCRQVLKSIAAKANCFKCGRLFCSKHSWYYMKLARDASWDTSNGTWSRVCEACFSARDTYNDVSGLHVDKFSSFKIIRAQNISQIALERSRLGKRLKNYLELMSSYQKKASSSYTLKNNLGLKSRSLEELEQTVITWEKNLVRSCCPYCSRSFSIIFRRHHCRLCGIITCAGDNNKCSILVAIDWPHPLKSLTESMSSADGQDAPAITVRLCYKCEHILYSRVTEKQDVSLQSIYKTYNHLRTCKEGIVRMLSTANVMINEVDTTSGRYDVRTFKELQLLHKRTIDLFGRLEKFIKELAESPIVFPSEKIIQKNMITHYTIFIQDFLPQLQNISKYMKKRQMKTKLALGSELRSPKIEDFKNEIQIESANHENNETLIILEEQKFLLQNMLKSATSQRKFDEISALENNLGDIESEIRDIERMIK